ncbi:cob(II)yrinic acid a,c-diamide reductase [Rhizobium sp. RU20A]|nr:cob(II)yrinic acid a,c-diamide reductase [Rhizobium sp. RU20A]
MEESHIDSRTYRDAMARLAGHVQLVTTGEGEARRGVTITAACSVSDNPPTVLVCLNAANPNNEIFQRTGCFALHVLGASQQPIADAFSGREGLSAAHRFALGRWTTLVTGAPVLEDAPAAFDCRIIQADTVGTHRILIGAVESVRLGPADAALLYLNRAYHTI